ncbi:MAG: hypothetical protein DHS20C16_30070 [Phycisphaerae bacterium]|nr:MAG: hypothetical protein DHS20C16_30070 [Phycisphaerae bacterium]
MKLVGKPIHIALGTIAFAAVFAAGVVAPHMRYMKSVKQGVASVQADLGLLGSRIDRARRVFESTRDKQKALESFDAAIPDRVQLGEFLEAVDRLAQEAGVADKNVTPSEAIVQEDLGCLPIQIRFTGKFASVYEFLDKVERLPRVARIHHLELSADDDVPDELVSTMTLHVYFRNS